MALRLTDVLMRRLHLFHEDRHQASGAAPRVAERMAELLGWDGARAAEELEAYGQEVERSRAFLQEVARAGRP